MNQLHKMILATIVVLIVMAFLGRLIFLSGITREISQAENRLVQMQENHSILQVELEKLRQDVKSEVKIERSNFLIKPNQKQSLLKSVLACGGNMRIHEFEILPSYRVKGSEETMQSTSMSDGDSFRVGDEIPQLDDQGMPVGISTEDDYEWPGAEIVPIKFSFKTTYRNLGKFFARTQREMPVNVIRSMDIMVEESGLCRGTLVLLFPVSEN